MNRLHIVFFFKILTLLAKFVPSDFPKRSSRVPVQMCELDSYLSQYIAAVSVKWRFILTYNDFNRHSNRLTAAKCPAVIDRPMANGADPLMSLRRSSQTPCTTNTKMNVINAAQKIVNGFDKIIRNQTFVKGIKMGYIVYAFTFDENALDRIQCTIQFGITQIAIQNYIGRDELKYIFGMKRIHNNEFRCKERFGYAP